AAMGRRPVLQRFEEEAEPQLRLLAGDTKALKDARLQGGAMDTHAAAADFGPVEHEVVRLRPHRAWIALELLDVLVERRREWMVHRVPSPVFRVVFEQGEVGDPQKLEGLRVQQVLPLRDREAELTEQLRRAFGGTGGHQQ